MEKEQFNQLVAYVKGALAQGTTQEQVRLHLYLRGWKYEDINEAIRKVTGKEPEPETQEGLAAKVQGLIHNLSASIRGAVAQGFSLKDIQDRLFFQGWPQQTIHEATQKAVGRDTQEPVITQKKRHPVVKALAIILLVLLVLGGLGYAIYYFYTAGYFSLPASIEPGVSVSFPQATYARGEVLDGASVRLTGLEEGIDYLVLFEYRREGISVSKFSTAYISGQRATSDGFTLGLEAFRMNETDYYCCKTYFLEEGTYAYEVRYYACPELESSLGRSCSELTYNDASELIGAPSQGSDSASITVLGGENPSECLTNAACGEEEVCEAETELCRACVRDVHCAQGFTCEQYECVAA